MKIQTLSLLAAGSTCIIVGSQASAQISGISVASKPNEFGLLVCNVYAEFDVMGINLLAIGGAPFVSSYTVIDGTFYQSPFGTDRPPNPALFTVFPSLRYDSFVTIGVKSFNVNNPGVPEGQPEDVLTFAALWPGFGPSSLVFPETAYHVNADFVQGNPYNPDFVRGDGGILIGQFSTENGTGFTGDLQFNLLENGSIQHQFFSFVHTVDKACFEVLTEQTICNDNGFTFAVNGVESCSGSVFSFNFSAAGGAVGQEMCFSVLVNDGQGQECCAVELCTTIPDCGLQAAVPFDLNGDGTVGIPDMLELLGAWGPCGSCFTPWTCPADFDSDCSVGIQDFLVLLGNWS
jgi:hypothetical protein